MPVDQRSVLAKLAEARGNCRRDHQQRRRIGSGIGLGIVPLLHDVICEIPGNPCRAIILLADLDRRCRLFERIRRGIQPFMVHCNPDHHDPGLVYFIPVKDVIRVHRHDTDKVRFVFKGELPDGRRPSGSILHDCLRCLIHAPRTPRRVWRIGCANACGQAVMFQDGVLQRAECLFRMRMPEKRRRETGFRLPKAIYRIARYIGKRVQKFR